MRTWRSTFCTRATTRQPRPGEPKPSAKDIFSLELIERAGAPRSPPELAPALPPTCPELAPRSLRAGVELAPLEPLSTSAGLRRRLRAWPSRRSWW